MALEEFVIVWAESVTQLANSLAKTAAINNGFILELPKKRVDILGESRLVYSDIASDLTAFILTPFISGNDHQALFRISAELSTA